MSKDIQYLRWSIEGAQLFSTCSRSKFMAIILDSHQHVVGVGYNGSPKGMKHCNAGGCPRANVDSYVRQPGYDNCIAIHAEANALLHSDYTARSDGGTLYVNGMPCYDCAKLISNSGIKRVVYLYENRSYPTWVNVKIYMAECGIELVGYTIDDLENKW